MLDKLALILVIIGAINWGSIGLFQFDIVGWIFGGQSAVVKKRGLVTFQLSSINYNLLFYCFKKLCCFICALPGKVKVGSADMTVSGNVVIDGLS